MPKKDHQSENIELEATLIICAENPQEVVNNLSNLTSIATYLLLPQKAQEIHDLYLDTPDRVLQDRKFALRIRDLGSTRWITLKGPSQTTDWGGMERLEIEMPWSHDAVRRVLEELWEREIRLWWPQGITSDHPSEVLSQAGLEVIQDRESHRTVRNLVPVDEERSQALAELAIDSVIYHFREQEVRHYEVEIEAKARDGSTVVQTAIESFIALYRSALRRWNYSKLVTGKAIENMVREGTLEGLCDNVHNLQPAAYEKIAEYLQQEGH